MRQASALTVSTAPYGEEGKKGMQPSENIAMTVYGPEVARSSLTSLLDRYIGDCTGLEAAERFWVMHDAASINRFYSLTDSTHGTHWPLVVNLFDGRTACVTFWRGQGALGALQGIKGATQPAKADPRSIRGHFWCDNPVCNLLHVSDDPSIMREELRILRFLEVAGGQIKSKNTNHVLNNNRIKHSALWEFSKTISVLARREIEEAPLPESGKAKETAKILINYIIASARNAPDWVEDLAIRFLNGESSSMETIKTRCRHLSAWQSLVLECGLHSNPIWMEVIGAESVSI